ncbi:MAG: YkgJ family cysteine cluster protein [Promethearchaeota archaeon]
MELNFLGKNLFNCMRCGLCCTNKFKSRKEIYVYPDEAEVLVVLAFQNKISAKIKEDLVFPDIKNKILIVARYKIAFNNDFCPFLQDNICKIYDNRPLCCRAFPLIVSETNSGNFKIELEDLCESLKIANIKKEAFLTQEDYKKYFPIELKYAKEVFRKEKAIMMQLQKMQAKSKINLGFNMSRDEYANALRKWEKIDLFTDLNDEDIL